MRKPLRVGSVYGGVKVIDLCNGDNLIMVKCMRCEYELKREREWVALGLLMSCGGFGCSSRARELKAKEGSK